MKTSGLHKSWAIALALWFSLAPMAVGQEKAVENNQKQDGPKVVRAKAEVAKALLKGYTVNVKLPDGTEFRGKVIDNSDEGFTVSNAKKGLGNFSYAHVERVKKHNVAVNVLKNVGWGAVYAAAIPLCIGALPSCLGD